MGDAYRSRYVATTRASILLITIFIASLFLLQFNNRVHYRTFSSSSSSSNLLPDDELEGVKQLDGLLQKAAMPNKIVIFTSVNAGWAENGSLFDIFMEAFNILNSTASGNGLLNHLIVIAFDETSFNRCKERHSFCHHLKTEGVDLSSPKAYMTPDYVEMMWRRIKFLRDVLIQGYNFIFTDIDIIWLHSPFPYLLRDQDFQIACDQFYGDAKSLDNAPNGGFIVAQSNERTISFFKFWYDSRLTYPTKHDQDVFIEIRRDTKHLESIGVKIAYLDTSYFVSFCSYQTFNISVSSTIHSNCCNGRHNKERNLRMILQDWKELILNATKLQTWAGPEGCTFASVP